MPDRTDSLLELLIQINHDVAAALDLRTVLQRLILAATRHVGADRASIIVVDESGRPVDASILYGNTLHHHTTRQLKETVERGLAGWVIRSREPVLLADTREDARWLQRPDDDPSQSGPKSALCVPLLARGQAVGALTLVHPVPNTFTSEHLRLAQAIADQAGIAVLNARLYADSSRQAKIMTALVESAASFGGSLDLAQIFQRVLSQTMQTLRVEAAALGLLDGSAGELVLRAAAGPDAELLIGRPVPRTAGAVAEVLASGRAMAVADPVLKDDGALSTALNGFGISAVLLAPIEAQGKPTGVIFAFNPVSGKFEPDSEPVLRGIGALAGATIRNAQMYGSLQRAQRRYLELFEESFDVVFVTDVDGRILEANRQAARVSGLPTERLKTMGIAQLQDIDWSQVGKDFSLLQRHGSARYESAMLTATGESVPVEVRASPIEFSGASAILWTLHDLTERNQLNELRESLTTTIYHDLRSPLSNLSSSLQLLATALPGDDVTASALQIAEHSSQRMGRLINSLLDMTRLEAGHKLTSLAPNEPGELVRAALRDVADIAEAGRYVIRTQIAADLPTVMADGDMLRRVLVNLLENALKFSKSGSLVEIGVQFDGESVDFWVQDQGPGIPVRDQKRIFEKFARLHSTPDSAAGLGLGLPFCQLAARAHNGTIRVESREGEGARFIVSLPANTTAN